MSSETPSELIYRLDDKPPVLESFFAAIQHLLASFVGIVTPTLIIGSILGLQEQLPYLISMSLIASGIGTFVQAYKPFGIGAGMLCVQGTSFTFLGAILSAGFMARNAGGGPEEIIALITSLCFIGSFVQIGLSQFIPRLRKIVTPLVTGIVITSIGISLIKVGMTDLAGGLNSPEFGSPANLMLGFFVIAVIILMNISSNNWVRLSSIVVGLIAGFGVAALTGMLSPSDLLPSAAISVPIPFKYGFNFELAAFIPLAVIYIISSVETTGDITANCVISGQPIAGEGYIQRIKSGVLGDGINSMIAAVLNSFPNTTFSQNTGVIQLTGIASRHIGMYIAGILVFIGLFQGVGDILQQIPKPVLGGATLVMFGTVAAAGIKILASEYIDRRKMIIIAVSLGLGLGLALVPDVFAKTPDLVQNIFSSPAATAGLTAMLLSLILPELKEQEQEQE
jgi:xanthine permease XanP